MPFSQFSGGGFGSKRGGGGFGSSMSNGAADDASGKVLQIRYDLVQILVHFYTEHALFYTTNQALSSCIFYVDNVRYKDLVFALLYSVICLILLID